MDAGAFGCLGVGVPFAIAAALAFPGRQVISVTGDGAFGFNAMEIDTAVRHGAKAVFIVSNNAAWNIERYDQEANYGGRVVGTTAARTPTMPPWPGPWARMASGSRMRPSCAGAGAGAGQRAGPDRRRHLADGGLVRREEGPGLRAGLPGADRLGRCGEETAGRLGWTGPFRRLDQRGRL